MLDRRRARRRAGADSLGFRRRRRGVADPDRARRCRRNGVCPADQTDEHAATNVRRASAQKEARRGAAARREGAAA